MEELDEKLMEKVQRSPMDDYEKYERFRRKYVKLLFLVLGGILLAGLSATIAALWIISK